MVQQKISGGVAHELPKDFKEALIDSPTALRGWEDITPLARNEWICWIVSVKTPETRQKHISRAIEELAAGERRPCCWMGCVHRTDKKLSPSQKYILSKQPKASQ